MADLTVEQFESATRDFDREAVHLELRDSYGTEIELPHIAQWEAGQPDDYEWMTAYMDEVRSNVASGRRYRRAHVVSEPLSRYQRWSHGAIGDLHVSAGVDLRWVPRVLVSSVALPGNDFWMMDERFVIFHHYSGDGRNVRFTSSTMPYDIELCRSAFEAVWQLGIPHGAYQPR